MPHRLVFHAGEAREEVEEETGEEREAGEAGGRDGPRAAVRRDADSQEAAAGGGRSVGKGREGEGEGENRSLHKWTARESRPTARQCCQEAKEKKTNFIFVYGYEY